MNEQGNQVESEFVFRRLVETFKLFSNKELSGQWWLLILGIVLLVGLSFVVWMYIKDSRSVGIRWALPLAALRILVYLVLALMFLMPAKQGYERVEKQSRVLIVVDISDSMALISDDASSGTAKPVTRLQRVMDYLSDEKISFVKGLLERNPVYVYRVGNRLDEDSQLLERGPDGEPVPIHKVLRANGATEPVTGNAWKNEDWQAFASYDFKPWLLRGLSEEGAAKVRSMRAWDGNAPGTADWASRWFENREESIPTDLNDDDAAAFNSNREKLGPRIEVARSISGATNIPDSMVTLINREAGNMVRGIILFSDGQSNLGNDAAIQELKTRSERDRIPVFTVSVGSEIKSIQVRITDVLAPDQTPPDEPFKVIVEQDGEGLVGATAKIFLEIKTPKDDVGVRLPMDAVYQPGEPPHAQAEFVIDPEKVPEQLKDPENPRQLLEGDWRVRAVTPRVEGERYQEKEHFSEWSTIRVQKKPARVLILCSAPTRDVQFLLTQMLRDKADCSLYVQNTGGTKGEINLLEEKERQLTRFPDRLNVDENPAEDVAIKWYNLARYDVIIAFDFDWNELTLEQTRMLQAWVDLQAGGLLFVAGQIHTKHLARPDAEDKFRPLIDILPVLPGDPDLAAAKRTATTPWRLDFENLSGDLEFMKLDETFPRPETGWEMFFTGRDERDDKARMLRGFYNYFPLRDMKPVATPIARFPDPNAIKMPDGKSPPWIAVMQYGQGRTAWVGSPEIWRLRQYKEEYFERFWTKFIRYLAAGSRRKQTRRGRVLMSSVVGTGGYVRVTAEVLEASLQPTDPKTEPKIVFRPVELEKYPPEIDKLTGDETIARAKAAFHDKFTQEFRMAPKKETPWKGYFQIAKLATPEKFPPGSWRVEVEIPSSTDTLKQKFMIRQSNPELDVTRPDEKAMYQLASSASLINVKDKALENTIKERSKAGTDGKRLSFKFGDEESLKLIPPCIDQEKKTARNRGAVEDYWDKGLTLPSFLTNWFSEKPQKLAYGLLLVIGLLSIEWLTRKLLKLA